MRRPRSLINRRDRASSLGGAPSLPSPVSVPTEPFGQQLAAYERTWKGFLACSGEVSARAAAQKSDKRYGKEKLNTRKTKIELFLSNEEVEFIDSMRSGQMTRAAIIGLIIRDAIDESKPRSDMPDGGSRENQEGL